MLLIDGVEAVTAQGGTGRVRLEPGAWHADGSGRTPAWFGLEFMAQTIAACRGRHLAATGGAPRGGYLVAARNYRCAVPHFPPAADLEIRVELLDEDPSGLCAFQCAILDGGQVLATALVKVMEK
jgi:predicted hotdog family 3-hydroxylacyl-ACP dehydratase